MNARRAATLFAFVLVIAGCGSTREEQDALRAARTQRELGLVPPYHVLSAGFVPDGGSGIAHFTDARGTPLWILLDARMWDPKAPFPQDRDLRVHLNERGRWEGARALAYDSAAESAVVDLFESAIRSLVSVKRESTMLRDERLALEDTANRARWGEWLGSLTPDEERAHLLRRMISRVEDQKSRARARAAERRLSPRQVERIREQLGLELPVRLISVSLIDDGGTGFVSLVDVRGETLLVVSDNRPWPVVLDSKGRLTPPPARHVYLHAYPTKPGARRLEFNSAAESAVVDLLRLRLEPTQPQQYPGELGFIARRISSRRDLLAVAPADSGPDPGTPP